MITAIGIRANIPKKKTPSSAVVVGFGWISLFKLYLNLTTQMFMYGLRKGYDKACRLV